MAKVASQPVVWPTVLDRLIGDAADERGVMEGQSIRDLEASVARDLEDLLNTRMEAIDELPPELQSIQCSLLTYGLPDLTTVDLASDPERRRVQTALETTIQRFEPRLSDVRVEMRDDRAAAYAHVLGFRIVGTLRVSPRPPESTFDAVLEMSSQRYDVHSSS